MIPYNTPVIILLATAQYLTQAVLQLCNIVIRDSSRSKD